MHIGFLTGIHNRSFCASLFCTIDCLIDNRPTKTLASMFRNRYDWLYICRILAKEPLSAFSSVTSSMSGIPRALNAASSFFLNLQSSSSPFLQHKATMHSAPKERSSVAAHPLQPLLDSQFMQSIPQIDSMIFNPPFQILLFILLLHQKYLSALPAYVKAGRTEKLLSFNAEERILGDHSFLIGKNI